MDEHSIGQKVKSRQTFHSFHFSLITRKSERFHSRNRASCSIVIELHVGRRIRCKQHYMDDVYLKLRDVVEKHLTDCQMVTLAIDGWSDHHHQETLAVVAKPLLRDSKPVLVKLGHLGCRPSAENLQQWLGDVHDHLTAIGVRTIAVIADNAPNITNALWPRVTAGPLGGSCS